MQYNRHPNPPYDLSSLGVYDHSATQQQFGSWYNPTTWFGGKKKKKGKTSAIEDLATSAGQQAAKTVTAQASKKASDTIKKKTGVEISAQDLTSSAKDISKGNISKGVTNLGTKAASQVVSKYGTQASSQLSQLTSQYTSALNVPTQESQISALTSQSSVPMQNVESGYGGSSGGAETKGLSTGAMIGIGAGVLGVIGVGGYLIWSSRQDADEQDRIENQQRSMQYNNLQAINNPKAKKSKPRKAKSRKR